LLALQWFRLRVGWGSTVVSGWSLFHLAGVGLSSRWVRRLAVLIADDARHRAQEELRSEFAALAALAAIEPDRAEPQMLLETETLLPW